NHRRLGALAFSFFAKGFAGSYMKSMYTQIERRFEISSSLVGLIDGSFEIGNLLVIILVSYLGPKVHRPKVIAAGCLVMSLGSFVMVVPHFIMGRPLCHKTWKHTLKTSGCKMASSYLWLFVLAGNLLRGIGEAPIMPLGMSYIDDFATEENSAFYIGTVRASGLFGPTFGFMLGSFCANLWVDIGVVDVGTLTITSKDMRWVGAWWLGVLLCGVVSFMASFPFWNLPRSLPKQGEGKNVKKSSDIFTITKDKFFPVLKKLLGNSIFLVYLFATILHYNSIVGVITYEPKFMEQQFNISISRATFLIGMYLLQYFLVQLAGGGFIIKKFKLHTTTMAKFGCITLTTYFLLSLLYFLSDCEVLQVAGLTVNYSGIKEPSFSKENLVSACNADCSCEEGYWDPVCGSNGITYISACLAGCRTSTGSGKDMVFHNCSCVGLSGPGNFSTVLGQCPRDKCTKTFPYFLALLATLAFTVSLGATPTYMIMSVSPELKSFAVGIETLCGRILGGLPAPIYFGALIDTTCLKWGVKTCEGCFHSSLVKCYNMKNNLTLTNQPQLCAISPNLCNWHKLDQSYAVLSSKYVEIFRQFCGSQNPLPQVSLLLAVTLKIHSKSVMLRWKLFSSIAHQVKSYNQCLENKYV
uniref:Solute carrier organic anion transporter family member n=1 Tax=Varanus komodoensis TaxID=61221 RepID=A0A8D2Q5K3_VARKO